MARASEHDYTRRKIGTIGPQISSMTLGNKWYLSDRGRVLGPMSWQDIKGMVDRGQVTPFAQIWGENWSQWMPIWYYFRIKTQAEKEVEALLPSRYDAMFYFGVFVFFIGIFSFFAVFIMGIMLFIISPIIEWYALYLESKHKGKAIIRTFGNAMAIVWMVIQIMVTIFFMSTLF